MDSLALELRRLIYESALADCVIPTVDDLARLAKRRGADVARALQELHDAHHIVLQPDGGEVLMAPPFSAVPTPFEVRSGDRAWFANCIWDAMGVAVQIGQPVTIATSCGCCGDALGLNVPSDWLASDSRVAHFALPAARWWDDIVFN